MGGIQKKILHLMQEPTEMRTQDVVDILFFFGYFLDRIHGSHYIFTKPKCDTLTLPSHGGKITKYYLKVVKKMVQNIFKPNEHDEPYD